MSNRPKKPDYTSDLVLLLYFTGNTATAIRMYSAYSGHGGAAKHLGLPYDPERDALDLMYLSDVLTQFHTFSLSLLKTAELSEAVEACDKLLALITSYSTDRPEFGSRQAKPTFDRWKPLVDLDVAKSAIEGIRMKAVEALE